MKRALYVLGGTLWFLVVFLVGFRLTFPSDAVIARIQYGVQEVTGGALAVDIQDLAPWWIGASAEGVQLLQPNDEGGADRVFMAESVRGRVEWMSLLRGAPRVNGALQVGDSEIGLVVGARMNQKGTAMTIGELAIDAPGLSVADLSGLLGNLEAIGTLDIEVALDASDTMRTATGNASILGRDIRITKLDLGSMGIPDLGLEIPIDTLDLSVDVAEGKATITRGMLRSALAAVDLEGEFTLRDDIDRSTGTLTLKVGDLGADLAPFKGFLGEPRADGKFHYKCSGTLNRIFLGCRAERERTGSPTTRAPVPRTVPTSRTDIPASSASRSVPTTMDEEERQRRRDELRERLRQRREERYPEREPADPVDEDWDEPLTDEADLPPEEEFFEEEPVEGFEEL